MNHRRASSLCTCFAVLFAAACGGDDRTSGDVRHDAAADGSAVDVAVSADAAQPNVTATSDAGSAAAHDASAPTDVRPSVNLDAAPVIDTPDGPPPPLRKLDILVMVDDSGSMAQEQAALKNTFSALVHELESLPGGLPDLHLGVVSSDVGAGPTFITGNPACSRPGGDRGKLDPTNKATACGVTGAEHFLSVSGAQKNFQGTLADAFGCMAQLGITGCGFEHQLQSARLALVDGLNADNRGFLRDDAHLLVIFLTDEDDCSGAPTSELYATSDDEFPNQVTGMRCALRGHVCGGQTLPNGTAFSAPLATCAAGPGGSGPTDLIPVREFVDFFRTVKRDPRQVLVAAMIGVPLPGTAPEYRIAPVEQLNGPALLDLAPVCSSANGEAAPALRLQAFVDSFGARGRVESICQGDFAPALARIGQLVRAAAM